MTFPVYVSNQGYPVEGLPPCDSASLTRFAINEFEHTPFISTVKAKAEPIWSAPIDDRQNETDACILAAPAERGQKGNR